MRLVALRECEWPEVAIRFCGGRPLALPAIVGTVTEEEPADMLDAMRGVREFRLYPCSGRKSAPGGGEPGGEPDWPRAPY